MRFWRYFLTRRYYDAKGNLRGYANWGVGRPPRQERTGCLTAFFALLFFLWPVAIIGKSTAGTVIGAIWFGVIIVPFFILMIVASLQARAARPPSTPSEKQPHGQ